MAQTTVYTVVWAFFVFLDAVVVVDMVMEVVVVTVGVMRGS
jgi:hypothetical protein